MGTFLGHIDEGLVFLVLGFWWMVNMFRDYRQASRSGISYRSRMSYASRFRKRVIPLETYLKISFPAVAIFGEIFAHGLPVSFVNEENRFHRLQNLQHMTIYGLFFIHGIVDLISYRKVSPITREMKYITAIVAFFWLPISTILVITIVIIWEMRQREAIAPQLIRCLGILILGTWFTQVSFILYEPFTNQGNVHNLSWNRTDMQNVHFVTSLYGFHIIFNLLVMILMYALVSSNDQIIVMARRVFRIDKSGDTFEYRKINSIETGGEVKEYHDLLEDEQLFV